MMGANTPTIDAVDPVAKISDLEVYVVEAVKVEKFLKMAVYFLESYGASIGLVLRCGHGRLFRAGADAHVVVEVGKGGFSHSTFNF